MKYAIPADLSKILPNFEAGVGMIRRIASASSRSLHFDFPAADKLIADLAAAQDMTIQQAYDLRYLSMSIEHNFRLAPTESKRMMGASVYCQVRQRTLQEGLLASIKEWEKIELQGVAVEDDPEGEEEDISGQEFADAQHEVVVLTRQLEAAKAVARVLYDALDDASGVVDKGDNEDYAYQFALERGAELLGINRGQFSGQNEPTICGVDFDTANYLGDPVNGVYYAAAQGTDGWFASSVVDAEHFTENLLVDDGPYPSEEEALAAGRASAMDWCSTNEVTPDDNGHVADVPSAANAPRPV